MVIHYQLTGKILWLFVILIQWLYTINSLASSCGYLLEKLTMGIFSSTGWVQLKLAEKANLEIENLKPPSDLTRDQGNQSRVGAAIDRLEGSLRK
jgi:hypothetical protein